MGAVLLTGLVTYTTLCITLLSNADRDMVVAATIFYMTGAVAGLFGQFYRESTNPTTVDDYGLLLVRLIATPLLSGLAGVGGAFISAVLMTINGQPLALNTIFSFSPEYLLIAAIFGLTPNLIIKSLQQRAIQYADDLQNSKSPSL